ncbi:choice-of-anchor B family protein (plasmid) [Pseudoalteromonas xiamenensis]|uniref:choice-of-anchor B family protein n=1 Tax=Pseudoalteromonas xiamenensis TaxID=882626 RepID=UPI0027E4A04B|nr:choice-of-anchor B family protein [Pseudoalteromonas xiamenensis]WMN61832.1 choice-of-anchor B family protein [Pseudoalteromonas xiamenensis]
MKLTLSSFLICCSIFSGTTFAHAEHDKARFVAADGSDKGRCDTPVRPCKSIEYAVKQAKKGDKVLVAEGNYTVSSSAELLALTSDMVPVLGGFNRFDHFLNQAPSIHTTTLYGVPNELKNTLYNKGFHIIQDGLSRYQTDFEKLKRNQIELNQTHSQTACVNGTAGAFACSNIDLVAHMPLSAFSQSSAAGNDIWGHVDLNDNTEYAIMGFYNGVAVVNLSQPENPTEVGFIKGKSTTWRDIKVYQFYSDTQKRWQAYAYVTSENGADGVMIIDLSNLPNSIRLVKNDLISGRAHNVYVSNVDYSLNIALNQQTPTLHLVGENVSGGAYRNISLASPRSLSLASPNRATTRSDYTHDAVSFWVRDSRASRDCQNTNGLGCEVFVDFNEEEVRLWDITDKTQHVELAQAKYQNAEYVHSGWWSEDGQYLFVHDEVDELSHGFNTTLRVFDVSVLTNPILVKEWQGPTSAIDHNGFVKGNRYYMSNYQRGLTVLDITNPTSPQQIGFFDTFPNSDGAQFNGAWGTYPYLPSGLILVSDINSGLYILRDQTKTSASGTLKVAQPILQLEPTATQATIEIQRIQGSSGAISVDYDVLAGNATATDFTPTSGTLTWAALDTNSKSISFPILTAHSAFNKSVFVRLHNVQGGATLTSHVARVNFGEQPSKAGYADIHSQAVRVVENKGAFNIEIKRINGTEGDLIVQYAFEDEAAGAIAGALKGELHWQNGETANKVLTFQTIDNTTANADHQYQFTLSGDALGTNKQLSVQILDDESNVAPEIYLTQIVEVNTRQVIQVSANVTDANNDAVTLNWTQTSGTLVTISDPANASINFQAPDIAGELRFLLTATDERGKSTEQAITVKVTEPATTTPVTAPSNSSGGSVYSLLVLMLLMLKGRNKN